jgi:hypothetical protein
MSSPGGWLAQLITAWPDDRMRLPGATSVHTQVEADGTWVPTGDGDKDTKGNR